MRIFLFKISRIWNRLAFWIIKKGYKMIWDYTGCNTHFINKFSSNHKDAKNILTTWPDKK